MIDARLIFYNFDSFVQHCHLIRCVYKLLTKDKKQIYKYYVYSRRTLYERSCDLIWEYLNEDNEEMLEMLEDRLIGETYRYKGVR